MKMKIGLCLALAAAFAAAPLGSAWAADAKGAKDAKETKETKEEKDAKGAKEAKADEEKTGPTDAEMAKVRKLKKPVYMKPVEALKAAGEISEKPQEVLERRARALAAAPQKDLASRYNARRGRRYNK